MQIPPVPPEKVNPCLPSPCGPYAQCQEYGSNAKCSCLPNFIGSPPQCRPECTVNSECNANMACINQKCVDPCPGACGNDAVCTVNNHLPSCSCLQGYTGDPFVRCYPSLPGKFIIILHIKSVEEYVTNITCIYFQEHEPVNPCSPSPCGANAECINGICTCIAEYHGDPYYGCKPECVLSTDCPRNKACMRNKCDDPCMGTCGNGAVCEVFNHIPMCTCPSGTTGNAFHSCSQVIGTYRDIIVYLYKADCVNPYIMYV